MLAVLRILGASFDIHSFPKYSPKFGEYSGTSWNALVQVASNYSHNFRRLSQFLEVTEQDGAVTSMHLLGTKNSQKICSIVTNRGFSVW